MHLIGLRIVNIRIEFNGGPLLANWISEFGAIKVAQDIEYRISEELK